MNKEEIYKDITVVMFMNGKPFTKTNWGVRQVTDVSVTTREGLVVIEYYREPYRHRTEVYMLKENVVNILID